MQVIASIRKQDPFDSMIRNDEDYVMFDHESEGEEVNHKKGSEFPDFDVQGTDSSVWTIENGSSRSVISIL